MSLQNDGNLPNSELGTSQMKSIFMELSNINFLSKKEKYHLLNEQLLNKFIHLTGLETDLIMDDKVALEQFYEQVRKLILKFEYGQRPSHSNIIQVYSNTQTQDSMMYILLEGCLQGQLKSQQSSPSDQNRIKDNTLFRKKPTYTHNNDIQINTAQDIVLIDQENYTKLFTLSHIKYLKFPKKIYTSIRNWITSKNSQINIKFMSHYLFLEPYQVKVHKLHKIPHKKLKNNQEINLSLVSGLIIVTKGQCKITLVQNNKNSTPMQYQLIITKGTTINNISLGQFTCQQEFKVKQIKGFKQCSIVVINLAILEQINSEISYFRQKIVRNLKYLQQCRNNYFKKFHQTNLTIPIKYYEMLNDNKHKKHTSNQGILHLKQSKNIINKSFTSTPNYQFVSFYEYTKMIQSKQIIAKHKEQQSSLKSKIKKTGKKKSTLEIQQQRKKQQMKKMLRLKMRAMAQKSIKINRKRLDLTISKSQNWFKRGLFESDYDDEQQLENSFGQSSICSKFIKDEIRLSQNDTGIINQFSKKSYKYRKQMNNRLNNSNNQRIRKSSKLKDHLKSLNCCNPNISQQSRNKQIMKSIFKLKNKNINCLSELASTAFTSNSNTIQQYSTIALKQVNFSQQKRQYHSINKDQRKILHRIQSGKIIRTIVHPTVDSYF